MLAAYGLIFILFIMAGWAIIAIRRKSPREIYRRQRKRERAQEQKRPDREGMD